MYCETKVSCASSYEWEIEVYYGEDKERHFTINFAVYAEAVAWLKMEGYL